MIQWPWPAPVDDGAAAHLLPGHKMPDIALAATTGDPVSLARTTGRCVLVIYPWTGCPGQNNPEGWDGIPGAHGSTSELEGFARLHHGFADVGVLLLGLSGQAAVEQRGFSDRHALPFPLLSDADRSFQRALELPMFEAGGKAFLTRLTLVLRDGAIEQVYYPVHPPDAHGREVMYLCGATRAGANRGR